MAPKTNCNVLKLASVVSYLQKSRVAHNIKDLEKHLPSVASINGMQVKDYLQALQDDNKINVEKIGSGNWYWSFTSQEKHIRQKALADARDTHDKATLAVDELKQKLAEMVSQRADEEDMLGEAGERREDLEALKATLQKDIHALRTELDAYKDNDPVELESKKAAVLEAKVRAEQYTDEIEAMESYITAQGTDSEAVRAMREEWYGDQYDAQEGCLREL